MRLTFSMPRVEEGGFLTFLVVVFILAALATFLYLQGTGKLADYKINMFSSIGTDLVLEEESAVYEGVEEGISIGVTAGEEIMIEETGIKEQIVSSGAEYQQTAQTGEGITHLARRAVKTYLEEHSPELTPEHKIFVEDYVQNRIGDRALQAGETLVISEDLIVAGINKAQELNPEQLENLENFTELVWEEGFRW